jgi:hypothetical protein
MNDIIQNATIVYKNGFSKNFEVITITEKGVYTGNKKSSEGREYIVNYGFIPIDKIKKIIVFKENGKFENIIF